MNVFRIQYDMIRKWRYGLMCFAACLFTAAVTVCAGAFGRVQTVASGAETTLTVAVDAGHGGMDGGVTGRQTKIKESDLNLAIALRLKDALDELGFEVVLTRKTEGGLYGLPTRGFKKRDMLKRKEIIQSASADLVISLHQNFYPSFSTRGAQVFYMPKTEQDKVFAQALQVKLNALYEQVNVKPRQEKTGDFFILDCAAVPSVIVECGFLSNAADEQLLRDSVWQRKLALAIASGAVAYVAERLS